MSSQVIAVSRSRVHSMSKPNVDCVTLLTGLGVEGDAHLGRNVKHRSRVARDPHQPNLRQVHLLHGELLEELRGKGFDLVPGQIGENITTRGIDLLGLPVGALLRLGGEATVEVTGLRNPCHQLDGIYPGLMKATLAYNESGDLVRKAGIMGVVRIGGVVRSGDPIAIELPELPYLPLDRV